MSSTSWGKDYFTAMRDQFEVSCNFQLSFAAFVYSGNSVTVMWWQATKLDGQANHLQLTLHKWTIRDKLLLFKYFDSISMVYSSSNSILNSSPQLKKMNPQKKGGRALMLQICSVKDKTVVLLSTLASGNDPLTVHKDKSFNYFDKVQHQNTLLD